MKSAQVLPYTSFRLSNGDVLSRKKALILSFFLIVFMGTRPVDNVFVDTVGYAHGYEAVQSGWIDTSYDETRGELLWSFIHDSCAAMGWPVYVWFAIIEALYIGLILLACYRMMSRNVYIAMLFVLSAFSFFSYGVNGIRNGMACSLIILALSYFSGRNYHKLIALALCGCAFFVHRSTILPTLCMIVSYYFIKRFSWSIIFWLFSILISLTVGGRVEVLFAELGFDDRFGDYATAEVDSSEFSYTGFRWDFLLYSSMPILLGAYITLKRKIYDKQYLLLFNTYVLCNAFWIMVIQASFSNRFAYLSWFMYPIVLAYPLLNLPIWKYQGRYLSKILLAHIGFTVFMFVIYYGFLR